MSSNIVQLPDPVFPSKKNHLDLLRLCETSKGYDFDKLDERDRWRLHAYDYGFRRVILKDRAGKSPIDRDGSWYSEKFADLVERMMWQQKCQKQFGTCGERWRNTGFVCCPACKGFIPDYRSPDELARTQAEKDDTLERIRRELSISAHESQRS